MVMLMNKMQYPKSLAINSRSRLADNFSCKVTLDIVTTVDNTDQIAELLHKHIRNTRLLGTYTLADTDYSANVVNPGLCTTNKDNLLCKILAR